MSASPSHVEIDGTRYRLFQRAQGHYKEWVESDVLRSSVYQRREVGASRNAEEPRPEFKTWRIDDWSAGEGYKFLDSSNDDPSQRGYLYATNSSTGDGVIDISIAGQVSLGYDAITSTTFGTTTQGPYLCVSGGNLWVAYDSSTKYESIHDGWNSATSGLNLQKVNGPISPHHSGIFIAGNRSGADGGVRRVTTAGNTSWVAESAQGPLAADNRCYYLQRGTTTSLLKRVGLDAAGTGATVTTFNGVGSTYAGSPVQSVAVGSRIYTLLANTNESPRLWTLENDVGREVAIFDGLRIYSSSEPGTQFMTVVNGIVFVGGYEERSLGVKTARLDYFDGQSWGTAFRLDKRTSSDTPIAAVAAGRADEVICAVLVGGTAHRILRYSLKTGAVSQFWAITGSLGGSLRPTSLAYFLGAYYMADSALSGSKVARTLDAAATSDYFQSNQTITEPIWDYDLPDTEKLLTEIEVQTESLAAGTSVEIQLVLDGSTTITTDASGASMSHSGTGATRKLFTLSNAANERTFRYIQPNIVLKATTPFANTPILYSVTLRCIPLATKIRKFEFIVDCSDETAVERKTGQQLSGDKIRSNLEALRDSTSNRVFTFTPLYKDAAPPAPGPTQTQHVCIFASGQENGVYEALDQGQGTMTIQLQKVG